MIENAGRSFWHRQSLRPGEHRFAPSRESRPEGTHPVQTRCRLRGKDGEVMIVDEFTGRLMPGRRWSDGLTRPSKPKKDVKIEQRKPDARHDHFSKLLPHVQEALRHDRYRGNGSRRVHQDLQARRHGDSDQSPDEPDRTSRTSIYRTEREKFERDRQGNQAVQRKGPTRPRRHDLHRTFRKAGSMLEDDRESSTWS